MGRLFWSLMIGRIKRAKFNDLFFESGSTLAYASSEFKRVLEASKAFDSRWKVKTNNVLTLLDYLLSTNVDVKPSPAGTPEDKYGAIFGDVLLRDPEAQPKFPRPLFPSEKNAVSETRETLQSDGNKRLYLMTASGIDLTHDEPAFRGPHVGSHPNALFKRAIFETGQPISLLLDAKKLEALFSFKVGECYPVFDGEVVWRDACHQYPLSLCIGYEHNGRDTSTAIRLKLIEMLEKSGDFQDFDFEYAYAEESEGGLLIVANSKFKEIFAEE